MSAVVTAMMVVSMVGDVPGLAGKTPTNRKTPLPAAALGQARARNAVAAPKPDAATAGADATTRSAQAAGVRYPVEDVTTVTVPATGTAVRAGTMPVHLAVARPSADAGKAPSPAATADAHVRVAMAAHTTTTAAGVNGMMVGLSATDGVTAPSASAAVAGSALSTSVALDYSTMANAGGDFAARLTLVELPACALTTPSVESCQRRTPLRFHNDLATHTITAQVTISATTAAVSDASAVTVVAATAGSSSSAGDYTATSLSPSATWEAGGSSGDFGWKYPLQVPPATGGPVPDLSIGYDSESIDGRLPANNNQPSWVGDGFDLPTSYIERGYDSCTDQGVSGKHDLCWKYDNATLVLNGSATELIKDDTTGLWRPKSDNGSRITRTTTSASKNGDNDGETWTVTALDGTQYVFGMNQLPGWTSTSTPTNSVWTVPVYGNNTGDPCHTETWCMQAWRWNLDYVVDPNGNTETLWYTPEYNSYAQDGKTTVNGTKYTRGGYLSRIDYGQTASKIYTSTAPEQVKFSTSERCVVTGTETCAAISSAHQADWPDVPFDQICAANTHCTLDQTAPSFFSTRRLTNVTTQYWTGTGTTYQKVDSWDLVQSFPSTGDGTAAPLWLKSITHTGDVGTPVAENPVTFGGIQLTNRVDTSDDSIAALIRWRVRTITSETGSVITIGYLTPQCVGGTTMPTPDANTQRCFPHYWTPLGAATPRQDWFQKYPVNQVLQSDPTTGSPTLETDYTYSNPAWRYDDTSGLGKTKYKTWSRWRGYRNVTTTTGGTGDVRTETKALYFQGMDGDKLAAGGTKSVSITDSQGTSVTDSEPLAGSPRETIVNNGVGGTEFSGTIHDKFVHQTASAKESWGTTVADIVNDAASHSRADLTAGGTRKQTITTTYDTSTSNASLYPATGLPLTVDDSGDTSITGDERCSRTTYAQNLGVWLMDAKDRTESVSVSCSATPSRPANIISDERTEYDNGAFGAAPTKGNATGTERLWGYLGSLPMYQTVSSTTFDALGRILNVTDALNHTEKKTYVPTATGPLTGTTLTNAAGQTTTTTVNPAWGTPTTVVDPNGGRTDQSYDAFGRLVSVWEANRSKTAGQNPNLKYTYHVSSSAPSTVATQSLNNDGSTYLTTSIDFYDAMLRLRQTQKPASQGGRVVEQTSYDSLGRAVNSYGDYTDATAPSTTMANVTSTWPKLTTSGYDGAGRVVATTLYADGILNQVTTTAYGGDRTTVTPPAGGTASTSITDVRDNVIERDIFNGSTPTGAYTATKYTYTPADKPASVTDASGNTWQDFYDLQGRRDKTIDPDAGTTTVNYDANDNVTDTTNNMGVTTLFSYDSLDRKTAQYTGSVAAANQQASWLYDTVKAGQLTSSTRYVGGATGAAYVNAVTSYDALYNVTGSKVTIPGTEVDGVSGSYTASAAYSLDGTLQARVVPAGGGLPAEALTYTYNDNREVVGVQGATGIVQSAVYTKIGQLQQTTLGVSPTAKWLQVTNTYDDGAGWLRRTLVTDDTNTTPDVNTTYGYDTAGNTTEVNDQGSGTSDHQCFSYGSQGRLAQAWTTTSTCSAGPSTSVLGGPAPYWLSWQYDTTGLRTQQVNHTILGTSTETDYTYPAAGSNQPHALKTTTNGVGGPVTGNYSYTGDGQTATRPGPTAQQTLTWDESGNLTKIVEGTSTTTNVYDADGTLLLTHGPAKTTLFVDGEQITVTGTGAQSCQRMFEFNGQPVAERTNAGLTWLVNDPHSTTTLAVDAASQATTHRYETPFNTARGTVPTDWVDNNGFLNKPYDPTTDLTYVGAREYDTTTGRFLSVDPAEDTDDPQSLTAYTYVDNTPLTASDPSGLHLLFDGGGGYTRTPAERPESTAHCATLACYNACKDGSCSAPSNQYHQAPSRHLARQSRSWLPWSQYQRRNVSSSALNKIGHVSRKVLNRLVSQSGLVGSCVSGSVGAGPISIGMHSGSICWGYDSGGVGMWETHGTSHGPEAGASISVHGALSNGKILDQAGPFKYVEGGYDAASGSYSWGTGQRGQYVGTATGGYSFGPSVGGSKGTSNTTVQYARWSDIWRPVKPALQELAGNLTWGLW